MNIFPLTCNIKEGVENGMTRQALLQILTDKGIRFEITEHVPVFTIDEMLAANLPHTEIIAKNLSTNTERIGRI